MEKCDAFKRTNLHHHQPTATLQSTAGHRPLQFHAISLDPRLLASYRSLNVCIPAPITPLESSKQVEEVNSEAQCRAGTQWESNCHFCQCSESGAAKCLKQDICNDAFGKIHTFSSFSSFLFLSCFGRHGKPLVPAAFAVVSTE
jgi:hypothetical protein